MWWGTQERTAHRGLSATSALLCKRAAKWQKWALNLGPSIPSFCLFRVPTGMLHSFLSKLHRAPLLPGGLTCIFPLTFQHQETDRKVEWVWTLVQAEGPGFSVISSCVIWANCLTSPFLIPEMQAVVCRHGTERKNHLAPPCSCPSAWDVASSQRILISPILPCPKPGHCINAHGMESNNIKHHCTFLCLFPMQVAAFYPLQGSKMHLFPTPRGSLE